MEDSLVSKAEQVEHIFLYKEFEKICPYFISIGMTYEQFWYEDTSIAKVYQEAFEIKEKREAVKNKWTIWEQGLYVYEALCNVSPILRPFSKVKKPLPYPEKPYEIDRIMKKFGNQKEEEEEELDKKKEEVEKMRAQIFFENWARATQKKFNKKGG